MVTLAGITAPAPQTEATSETALPKAVFQACSASDLHRELQMDYVRLNIDVDIDMSKFKTDKLIAELERKCKLPTDKVEPDISLQTMFTAQ